MEQSNSKKDMINKLQREILLLQGFKPVAREQEGIGLDLIETAFPNSVFPTGAIHEFISAVPEHRAACGGFIGGLLKNLMQKGGACLWVSRTRNLFPPSLKLFGVEPERMIFIDLDHEKDILWVMEEALKCKGLAAVIAEVRDLSFSQSRRLQLTLEKSKVTAFILRTDPDKISTTVCAARWEITPIASELENGMPGIGHPRWNVKLLRVRNGNPGSWDLEWLAGHFHPILETNQETIIPEERRKIG